MEFPLSSHKFAYRRPAWQSSVWAGLIAGVVFLLVQVALLSWLTALAPGEFLRMVAALLLGRNVLPPPATWNGDILAAAAVVHFGLSALLGVAFGVLVALFNLDTSRPLVLLAGLAFGLLVYFLAYYGMTWAFPWFSEARGLITAVNHGLFGLVLGEAHYDLTRRRTAR